MIGQDILLSATLLCGSLAAVAPRLALAQDSAITTDPAPDRAHPAAMQSFQLPSHGAALNAFVYIAAGAGPHPTVVLLHGFPGNERNLDLAQSLRRAGWNVLYFDYRGSWGSPGDFSFTHCIEDAASAIAYLRDPAHATKLRVDPKEIVLVGHSMGGLVALETAAADPTIRGVVTLSAADFGITHILDLPAEKRHLAAKTIAERLAEEGMAPLAGTSPASLANELIANATAWNFAGLAPKLADRPVTIITSDDGLAPPSDALVEALHKAGAHAVSATHMATDHSYSDHRIALEQTVLAALPHPSSR
jgi:pimeloyl-ACP methyl ester carboxylesterase